MRAPNRRLPWLLPTFALLTAAACGDLDRITTPEDALEAVLDPPAALSDASYLEISVLRAPGPDGELFTDDDIHTTSWPTTFMSRPSPPGDLWQALGIDLTPIDGGVAFTMGADCLGSQRPTPLNNWSGGVGITFLDPETGGARAASFVSVEVRNPPITLSAYDEDGVLLGSDALTSGTATTTTFLTVEKPGIARVDITGNFWCLAHRIRYTLDPDDVVVDTTPPELELAVTPDLLWPADSRHHVIALIADATDDTAAPDDIVLVAQVVSSDPDNGNGDGNTTGDIRVTRADGTVALSSNADPVVHFDPRTDQLELRAERAPKGGGRVYTISVTATDPSGNATTETVTVTVPVNQGRGGR